MKHDDSIMDDEQAGEAVARYLEENPELLEGIAPSHDLWPAIENRISARVLALDPAARQTTAPGTVRVRPVRWMSMLIAASALVATSAGVTYLLTTRGMVQGNGSQPVAAVPSTSNGNASNAVQRPGPRSHGELAASTDVTSDSNEAVAGSEQKHELAHSHLRRATSQLASHSRAGDGDEMRRTYDAEIATLHDALEARRSQLSPTTVAVIEQNLRVIDDAIRQSRAALAKDPGSRLLNDQLDRTLAKKTGLLRAAALLPAA